MDGLSHWLRQIIAVVLLASLIDLILPNRTMQRYVRLVAGLFILLTVATPIMEWMKEDLSHKLTIGLNAVDQIPEGSASEMARIEEEGAKLRSRQNALAAELVTAKLESAIRNEIVQSENLSVQKVDVEVRQEANKPLTVTGVIVLLAPDQKAASTDVTVPKVADVDPIAAVDIRIEVNGWADEEGAVPVNGRATQLDNAMEVTADKDIGLRVSALIASRFGISAHLIDVRQPAVETAESN